MTAAAELVVEISGKSTNLSDILRSTQSELNQAARTAGAAGDAIGAGVAAGTQKAAGGTAQLASAQARLASVSGDLAGAEQLLQSAIAAEDGETITAIRLKTQLVAVQQKLSGETQSLSGHMDGLKGALGGVQGALGAAGFAFGVQQLVQMGGELITVGNQANRVKSSFDDLAKAGGTSGNAMLTQLRQAANGEISDLNLELATNRAQLLGVAKSAQEMGQLLEIARDRAKKMGTDTSSALNDIVTGLGRASPMILDNLGFTIKLGEANDKYAKTLGIASAALSDEQKKEALKNAIIEQGLASINKSADATLDGAAAVDRLSASYDNLKAKAGSGLSAIIAPAANSASDLLNIRTQVEALGPAVLNSSKSFADYQQNIKATNAQLGTIGNQISFYTGGAVTAAAANQTLGASMSGLTEVQFNYAKSLVQSGVATDAAIQKSLALTPSLTLISRVQAEIADRGQLSAAALDQLSNSMLNAAASGADGAALVEGLSLSFQLGTITAAQMQAALDGLAAAHAQTAAATQQNEIEQQRFTNAAQQATTGSDGYSKSLGGQATTALVAKANSEALAIAQAAIANIAGAAANGMISDAQAAAILAGQYGVARGEALGLIDAQRQLAGAKAAAIRADAAAIPGGAGSDRNEIQRERQAQLQQERNDRVAVGQHIAQRQKQLDYDTSSNAQKLALINAELAQTKVNSDKYFDLKEKQYSLEQSLDKKQRGGAGGVKISDQQKLNNSLIGDQEKADDKAEQDAIAHSQNLLKIEQDYAKKSLEQIRANEISKRESQADFLDRLTSSELNKSKNKGDQAALHQIDADYQAAYAKAQEIAQAGNAKLSADYLAFKQKQAESELQYAEAVAKAKADKDKAEVGRLETIHKLRQDIAAEQEKQLLENGDSDVNARDAALSQENQRYSESQEKSATAAENAAERKIAAQVREGKKIDENNLKLKDQGKTLDDIANAANKVAPDAPTNTPGTTPPASAPAATTTTANADAAAQVAAVIDQALIDAVNSASSQQLAALGAINSSLAAVKDAIDTVAKRVDATTSAVRSIPRGVT